MSGHKKGPSHSENEAVDNTAFSSNNHVGKVKKGMDGYTASLILQVAKENIGAGADLYKAMNQKHTPKNDVERAHVVYEQLGYKVGATIVHAKSHAVGVIESLNTSTGGFYPGDRYPIYIKTDTGIHQYSILGVHYSHVKEYIHNPKKILKEYADDLVWKVIPDTILTSEQRQQYIEKQSELAKYDFTQQKEYFEHTKRSDFEKNDKLYLYEYLAYHFKNNNPLFFSFSENSIDDYTAFMVEHKINDRELSTWIETNYLQLLQVDSGYTPTDLGKPKNHVLFGVKTPKIVRIYNQLESLGKSHTDLKNKVGQILQERIDVIQGDQLYDFVAEVAGTPFEKIAFEKLESAL